MARARTAKEIKRMREIGARIKQAREETGGMSQRELGELIGVSVSSVEKYEQGLRIPHRQMAEIAEVTGVRVAWLYHGTTADDVRDEQLAEIQSMLREIMRRLEAR